MPLPRPQSNDPEALRQAIALFLDQMEVAEPWREIGASGNPSYENSWSTNGFVAAFRKNALGDVQIRGNIASGTIGQTAFTLPDGYRPPVQLDFAVPSNALYGQLRVLTSGAVRPVVGSNADFALNVTFRAA